MELMSVFIQIQKLLEENPQVWRYLGCASALVGLLCFAPSSYLKIIFKHWNLLKIVLYSIISVGICVAVWFAQDLTSRNGPTNRRLQGHMEFLVLTIVSIISFIIDKAVNKKPDGYGPTSCAAFAVMSFSLSRQTDFGFEVELLNFFLGTLIAQLARIKWWFCFAGVGFCYFLTILRSFLDAPSVDNDENLERRDRRFVAIEVDSQTDSYRDEILEDFRSTMKQFEKDLKKGINDFETSLQKYLTDEIDQIPLELVNDPNILVDQLPPEAIVELNKKVRRMIDVGLEDQCSTEYSKMQREVIEGQLKRYLKDKGDKGGRKLSRGPRREKEVLNIIPIWGRGWFEIYLKDNPIKIGVIRDDNSTENWIKVSTICMKVLFPNERRLCDRVFSGFSSVSDKAFMKVCRETTTYILNLAGCTEFLPNALRFQVLRTLHGLLPEFESVFSDECSAPLIDDAITVRNALAEKMRDYCLKEFNELEDMIRHGTEQESVPGGIDPITVSVMDLLQDDIFLYYPAVAVRMPSMIELLENHLEKRSKTFPNDTLGYVFLMNNQRYIEQKAQGSQLGAILGDEWIQRQTAKVRQHLELYQRSSWDKVLDILKLDNSEELNLTAESMIEKLGLFKTHIREIWNVQSAWFVNDEELREEIRDSLRKILLPAYAHFYSRLLNVVGKDADNIRIHSIIEIEDGLNGLFDGREN